MNCIPIPPTDVRHTVTYSHNPAILINDSNHTPAAPGMLSSIGVLCRASLHPERGSNLLIVEQSDFRFNKEFR